MMGGEREGAPAVSKRNRRALPLGRLCAPSPPKPNVPNIFILIEIKERRCQLQLAKELGELSHHHGTVSLMELNAFI